MVRGVAHPLGAVTSADEALDRSPTASTSSPFVEVAVRERSFVGIITLLLVAAAVLHPYPELARWFGFLVAGYAVVANDSIQTVGTFIASNHRRPWWALWLFIGGLFLLTVGASWAMYQGDVSWQRLASKGFDTAPSQFTFLHLVAPIALLVITRARMPVSTTFLILTTFSTSAKGMGDVMMKSFAGYGIAFVCAMLVWLSLGRMMQQRFTGEAAKWWMPAQWVTSGTLWSVWIMQDAANVAVYLPRSLSVLEFVTFAGLIFGGLGVLFWLRGDRIQDVVTEKSHVIDVRAATIIDLVYAVILGFFQFYSKVPMSTTWVFIGLLGGRELAMAMVGTGERTLGGAFRLMGKDVALAATGLIISIVIAASVNTPLRTQLFALVGM
jgi:hypothetical protein